MHETGVPLSRCSIWVCYTPSVTFPNRRFYVQARECVLESLKLRAGEPEVFSGEREALFLLPFFFLPR
jgi:hypothetical protein